MISYSTVTRRQPPNDALTRAELREVRHNLSHLSGPSVENFYREVHAECAVERRPRPESNSTAGDSVEGSAKLELALISNSELAFTVGLLHDGNVGGVVFIESEEAFVI